MDIYSDLGQVCQNASSPGKSNRCVNFALTWLFIVVADVRTSAE